VNEFSQQHPVDKLIIDLRWNNGGDTTLTPPILATLLGNTQLMQPGRFFVITSGYRTYSAAQNMASMLWRYTPAIFVGDTTGSSPNFIGEDVPQELPYSKLEVSISDLYWQGGWPTDYHQWVPPLLYTPRVFADYGQNRDPAMEAILAYR
jgi:hypothetical protein